MSARRCTYRSPASVNPAPAFRIHWGRIVGGLAVGVALAGVAVWSLSILADEAPADAVSVNEDPFHGVPWCTDAIADAGGICHGEPTAVKQSFTPTPTPAPTVYVEVPGPTVEVPVPGPTVTVEVPVPGPTVVNEVRDLPACEVEDADNCYWDAAAMGNGEGRSFVTLHGVTYYADQPAPASLRTVTLNGVTLPYVDGSDAILYCDQPLTVGVDVDDNGNEWAGCM